MATQKRKKRLYSTPKQRKMILRALRQNNGVLSARDIKESVGLTDSEYYDAKTIMTWEGHESYPKAYENTAIETKNGGMRIR